MENSNFFYCFSTLIPIILKLYKFLDILKIIKSKEGKNMSHGPAVEWKKDRTADKKAKMGLIMVSIYILVYAIFVTINVADPKLMKMDIGSLNLAIVYGFGLIVLALIQAFIYNHYCTRLEEKAEAEEAAEAAAEEAAEEAAEIAAEKLAANEKAASESSNVKILEEVTDHDDLNGGKTV